MHDKCSYSSGHTNHNEHVLAQNTNHAIIELILNQACPRENTTHIFQHMQNKKNYDISCSNGGKAIVNNGAHFY